MPNNATDPILAALLETLPKGNWLVSQVYLGATWTASFVENATGERRIGLANAHAINLAAPGGFLQPGYNRLAHPDARAYSYHALSDEPLEAAAGLATLNALLRPDPASLGRIDAGDWLVEQGRDRKVVFVGRFPFINEIEPVAREIFVFELDPRPGEFSFVQAPEIIPQADVLAVTGSTLLNHSLHKYLALAGPQTKVIVVGPSTPLSPVLFDFGAHVLSGIEVVDEQALLESLTSGLSFRRMSGTRRVSLENQPVNLPK